MNKIIFLGTGNTFNLSRQQTSLCFVTDKGNFLIDCGDGMGTLRNINRAKIKLDSINDIFLTHKHADHVSGIPFFILNKSIDEKSRFRVFGPVQTLKDIRTISLLNGFLNPDNHQVVFVTLKPNQEIRLFPGVRIKTLKMKDIPGRSIQEFAYAVTTKDKRIVYSGDTKYNPRFTAFARYADVLIHECGGLDEDKDKINKYGHSTARDAGECAQKAGVKHLILTHLPPETSVRSVDLLNEARKYFGGKVTVAEDLMEAEF